MHWSVESYHPQMTNFMQTLTEAVTMHQKTVSTVVNEQHLCHSLVSLYLFQLYYTYTTKESCYIAANTLRNKLALVCKTQQWDQCHEKSPRLFIRMSCIKHDVFTFWLLSAPISCCSTVEENTATIDCTGIDQLPMGSNLSCSVDGEPTECKWCQTYDHYVHQVSPTKIIISLKPWF